MFLLHLSSAILISKSNTTHIFSTCTKDFCTKHLQRLWCWSVTHEVFKHGWDSWGHGSFQSYMFYQCWGRHFQPVLDKLVTVACLLLSFPGAKLNTALTSNNFQSGVMMQKVQVNLISSANRRLMPTCVRTISLSDFTFTNLLRTITYIELDCLFQKYVCCQPT